MTERLVLFKIILTRVKYNTALFLNFEKNNKSLHTPKRFWAKIQYIKF